MAEEVVRKLRLGFVGCGVHSTQSLYPCIPHIEEIDLVAVCDLKEELARRNARNFGAKAWYTDLERMIDSEELDAVAIVGPPPMHTELGVYCLGRGLHIFIEKPPALDVEGARKLVEASKRAGKFGQVAFMMRFTSAYRLAKEIVSRAEFGKPIYAEAKYFTHGPYRGVGENYEEFLWYFLLVQGVHPVDLIRYFMGEVKEVVAKVVYGEPDTIGIAAMFSFVGGGMGLVQLSDCIAPANLNAWFEITGARKSYLVVDNMCRLRYYPAQPWDAQIGDNKFSYNWEASTFNFRGQRLGYCAEMEHFAKSILAGEEPSPNLEDGYKAMVLIKAIHDSCISGGAVGVRGGE